MTSSISINRTNNYYKQLKGSFIFKALAVGCSFLIIPIMIKYLGNEQYGIWSTLLSIVSWIVLFDIGIGNGLRNKVSESLARGDIKEAQNYISTAYVIVGIISIALLTLFLLSSGFIPWQSVFNTSSLTSEELASIVNITVSFVFINFWLSLINQVFNGLQKTSLVVFNQFLSNLLSLISVYTLSVYFETSLYKLAFVYGSSLLLSSIFLSLWFYKKNVNFIPQIGNYANKYIKSIASLGFQFFIIQIAVVVIFTTDKILITQLFGPEHVTSYDVVFKLFSIITLVFSLINAPLTSAYNDAYNRNDLEWMKKIIKRQMKIYLIVILLSITLNLFSETILKYWIGEGYVYDREIIFAMTIYIIIASWNNIFSTVLGGLGLIRLGSFYTVLTGIINIPISYLYAIEFDLGVSGIIYGTVTSIAISTIVSPIQVYYFIFSRSKNNLLEWVLR